MATLNIYGDIVSGGGKDVVNAKNLSRKLEELRGVKHIDVYINSYGGEVAEGLAIYNALKRKAKSAKVTTYCDGFACSIASVVFMAGSERKMSKSSLLMVHNAWTIGMGNAEELRKQADDLEIITSASVEAYKENATISEAEIRKLMDAETWITPKDAVKYGFATEILEEETKNVSQNVRKTLFELVLAAEKDEEEEEPTDEENEAENGTENGENGEEEPENTENDENSEENGENSEENPEDEEEDPENDTNSIKNEEKDPEIEEEDPENSEEEAENEEETEEDEEKVTEKLSGFFNAILKI